MAAEDWEEEGRRCLGAWLNGRDLPETDERGQGVHDESFLTLFNAGHEAVDFSLPDPGPGASWVTELDTAHDEPPSDPPSPNGTYRLEARSVALLRQAEGA
jgi:glycogen operon protein